MPISPSSVSVTAQLIEDNESPSFDPTPTNGRQSFAETQTEEMSAHSAETQTAPVFRDEEKLTLAGRVQNLYRSLDALRGLLRETQGEEAASVTVEPRLEPASNAAFPRTTNSIENDDPWWPGSILPDVSLVPPPGFTTYGLLTEDREALAFSVVGLRDRDLVQAVAGVLEDLRQNGGFKPVFLTDSPDLLPMIREGLVAEYLPSSQIVTNPEENAGWPEHRIHALRQKWGFDRIIDLRTVTAPPEPAKLPKTIPGSQPETQLRRPRAAVVAWDLGHNPAGRAMVLYDLLARDYDVELVGPLWSRFGSAVWHPIRDSGRTVRSFRCDRLEDFWPRAVALAETAEYDLVVVCKPRLPALLLGALIKKSCDCPLVLDIDDFELSFFRNETAASLDTLEAAGPDALAEPYLELSTRVCDGLVNKADATIVSNIALRDRFGGHIVRHARDETLFNPARFDHQAAREAMGMSRDDFAIVFVGTIRKHKGVIDVAQVLDAHPDKRFVLHLIGDIPDRQVRDALDRFTNARVVFHPSCSFEDLPERLVAADAVILLQDDQHPISQFQLPAKLSDASALGLPILATDVPPLRDLALQGIVRTIELDTLADALDRLMAERDAGTARETRRRVRDAFEAELGLAVNRERFNAAIARASEAAPGIPQELERLIDISSRAYAKMREPRRPASPPLLPTSRAPIDIVMFWKQNDTGLFGRRSDMLMKHLLASGRINRVLQFDAPMEMTALAQYVGVPPGSPAAHILESTIDNQYGLRDSDRHRLRTYLRDKRGRTFLSGPESPAAGGDDTTGYYPAYVAAQMEQAGMRAETTFAWVCPIVFDFPRIAAHIPFRGIIGDLIDDQRRFDAKEAYRERIAASYEETLPLFDITFTNCEPMAESFRGLAAPIHVVRNGTERTAEQPGEIPVALRETIGPVAGYVGNLRDRFDWDLMRDVALKLPNVSFPIIGGGARQEDADKVLDVPNIHFLGMVPYRDVPACMRSFDVALVPHVRSELTQRMNPLKTYNYFAAHRPIVSTEVENIDRNLRPFIRFATDADDFAAAITDALAHPLDTGPSYQEALSGILWESRVAEIIEKIDNWLDGRR